MKSRYFLTLGTSFAIIVTLFVMASPMLRYAEGWNTFYYDNHFITNGIAAGNTGMLIEGFFLQFFHTQWHGIVVMSVLLLALELSLILIARRYKKWFINCIAPFIITICLTTFAVCKLSHTSVMTIARLGSEESSKTVLYQQLSNMERESDWDGIIAASSEYAPETNLLVQNMVNMAMAERLLLHEHLYDNTCVDINSIYVSSIQSEYIAALLSDIYYSMGHIAQAQRYAFEANEKMDNNSPRLLQRLIKTNIIYGHYEVARKYLHKLSAAAYYSDWCDEYSKKLSDAAVKADKELSEKRLCLNIRNKFSGFSGLDKDLLMIARATKGHRQSKVAAQYLSALYRLAGYKEEYQSLLKEFQL